jgi:hypothetical protein
VVVRTCIQAKYYSDERVGFIFAVADGPPARNKSCGKRPPGGYGLYPQNRGYVKLANYAGLELIAFLKTTTNVQC